MTAQVVWQFGRWYVHWLDNRGMLVGVSGPFAWRCEAESQTPGPSPVPPPGPDD